MKWPSGVDRRAVRVGAVPAFVPRRPSAELPEPHNAPIVRHLDAVPLTDRRRKDEPQTLDVRGQLHRGAQALADVGVEAKVGVIVADPERIGRARG